MAGALSLDTSKLPAPARTGAERPSEPSAVLAARDGSESPRHGEPTRIHSQPTIRRRVLRNFGGPEGRVYERNEVVDVTGWRHADRLVEQHKLSTETV